MHLREVPLPEAAREILVKEGYAELYPPQEEALRKGVLDGRNLVLASPTASGKTLVAELCALKHVLELQGKVLYLTPLRALASEKYDDFRKFTRLKKPDGQNVAVGISTGDYDSDASYLARYDIIIATNEKADSLIRHRAHWINDITLVVADEVHLLQEHERGPTLEVALTRLRHINPKMHLLSLSATVSNADEIAAWLEADAVTTNWRPVPLREGVLLLDELFFNDGGSEKIPELHGNQAVRLALRTISQGDQALLFAETRKTAVSLAQKSAAEVKRYLSKREKHALQRAAADILEAAERTRLSETLAKLVESGVAFHHAGLHSAHRRIVETSFRQRLLKLISATPTLAAGVNLPARTVVINSYVRYEPGLGRLEIPIFEYKQMAGRAGRPRYDEVGEAILIAKTLDEREALMESYICSGSERIWSKLMVERILRSHALATIASGFANSEGGLLEFFGKTFHAHQYGENAIRHPVMKVLEYLHANGMVEYRGKDLKATEFGRRVSELYIDPESAVVIRNGLFRRAPNVTAVSFLHLVCHTPDVSPKLYCTSSEAAGMQLFMETHKDEFMIEMPDWGANASGYVTAWTDLHYETILAEMKSVRILNEWTSEIRENELLEEFGVEPGDLYRLVETADWLLYATQELAALFRHKDLMPKIATLRLRVKSGVKEELVPLVSLESVGRIRGRALFNAGYRSIELLKKAQLQDLVEIPGIGPHVARRIKEQLGGFISKRAAAALNNVRSEQKTLLDS